MSTTPRPATSSLPGGPGTGERSTGQPADPTRLVARTVELPRSSGRPGEQPGSGRAGRHPVDLLEVAGDHGWLFEREGAGLAGRGVALRLDFPEGLRGGEQLGRVAAALAAIPAAGEVGPPGTGPVALGALPFDPGAPATLVVPAVTVWREPDGRAWRTTIEAPGGQAPSTDLFDAQRDRHRLWPPDHFRLRSPCSHQEWCRRVGTAVGAVRAGRLEKVVLARDVVVEANRPILTADVLSRLRALYPACTTFSVEGFVGASPELLVSRRGARVASHPLAGTVARSGDPDTDSALAAGLLASAKETHEHRMVVDAVVEALEPLCARLDAPASPAVLSLRNVSHLATLVEGDLAATGGRRPSALDLAALLHPTPAVAGTPRAQALEVMAELEGLDRGRYAGPVGWVDSRGDGDWVIGIRSATLDGATARLVAGVGIVADSDPRTELAETQLKLQALLAAVVRP